MATTQKVSWNTYAQTYDMLMAYNPFYLQLHQEVINRIKRWNIPQGSIIADIGAGTGNYSLAIAEQYPHAHIIHIDNDKGMNAQAARKKEQMRISNHAITTSPIQELELGISSLDALVSIHALYTFPNPKEVLHKMYHWLKPGGKAIFVNAGRIVNVFNWQLAISWHLIRNYGLRKTLKIFSEAKEVSRQNTYIRNMQKNGTYWTHSHQEFIEAINDAGFKIIESKLTFRGISDLVVVRKLSAG